MGRVGKLATGGKAVFAGALGLIAALTLVSHAFAGSPTLNIGHVTMLPGENVQMHLQTTDVGSPGLGAWQIDIDYNPDIVTPLACTAGPASVCNVNYGPGTVRVVGAASNGRRGDVTLSTVQFRCDHVGATALAITAMEFHDATSGAPQPINVNIEHGSINCLSPEPPQSTLNGDANCDGLVNSIDALIVLQYVAALRSSVPCPNLADYNHDGRISAVDAALILQRDAGLI
jgi:hypothetical protein